MMIASRRDGRAGAGPRPARADPRREGVRDRRARRAPASKTPSRPPRPTRPSTSRWSASLDLGNAVSLNSTLVNAGPSRGAGGGRAGRSPVWGTGVVLRAVQCFELRRRRHVAGDVWTARRCSPGLPPPGLWTVARRPPLRGRGTLELGLCPCLMTGLVGTPAYEPPVTCGRRASRCLHGGSELFNLLTTRPWGSAPSSAA